MASEYVKYVLETKKNCFNFQTIEKTPDIRYLCVNIAKTVSLGA